MNLEQIRQANPGDAKTGIVANAKVLSAEGITYTTNGKPKQTVLIADGSGQHKITLYLGSNAALGEKEFGTFFDFKVWCNNYKNQVYLQAFLDNPEPVHATATEATATNKAVSTQDNEARRGYALRYAVDLAVGGVIELGAINGFADEFVAYMENKPVHQVQQAAPQTGPPDEDMPWTE